MDVFTYLMAKKGHNTGRDLFSYLLGKNAGGGSGTYTTFSGISLNISNTVFGKIKNFMLNSTELTQDGTPTPDNPVDVNVITGSNNIKITNENIFNPILLSQEENYNNFNNDTGLWETSTLSGYYRSILYNVSGGQNVRDINKLIFLKANTNYTIKFYDFSYTGSGNIYLSYGFFDDLGTYINQINGNEFVNITTPNQSCYLDIRRVASSGNFKFSKIMIIEGTYTEENIPTYVEHQEQNYPISLASKNLFDFNKVVIGKLGTYGTVSVNGNVITFTATGQQVYGVQINLAGLKLKNNTTYTVANLFSITTSPNPTGWRYYNGSSYTVLNNYREYFTFTTTESGVNQLLYYIGSPATFDGTLTLSNIQLLEGNIAKANIPTYEPYYNIEYGEIGDYADQISNQFESKNLFDKDTSSYKNGYYINSSGIETETTISGYTTTYTKVKPNTIYTLSGTIRTVNMNGAIYCYDNNKNWIERKSWSGEETSEFAFTTPNNCYYIQFQYTQSVFDANTVQLEEGSTATEYMPYGITKGEWYLKKKIGKVVLNGSENWQMSVTSRFYLNINKLNSSSNGFCNFFAKQNLTTETNGITYLFNSPNIYIQYNEKTSVSDFKTWLSTNNTIVYYQLSTPQYIHISQENYPTLRGQLEEINTTPTSYTGTTNVTQENDDLPFNISVDVLIKEEE